MLKNMDIAGIEIIIKQGKARQVLKGRFLKRNDTLINTARKGCRVIFTKHTCSIGISEIGAFVTLTSVNTFHSQANLVTLYMYPDSSSFLNPRNQKSELQSVYIAVSSSAFCSLHVYCMACTCTSKYMYMYIHVCEYARKVYMCNGYRNVHSA